MMTKAHMKTLKKLSDGFICVCVSGGHKFFGKIREVDIEGLLILELKEDHRPVDVLIPHGDIVAIEIRDKL